LFKSGTVLDCVNHDLSLELLFGDLSLGSCSR
jgi:hypothetical protein